MENLQINDIYILSDKICIKWSSSIGFGEVTLGIDDNGNVWAETENLGRDFLKAVLEKIASTATIIE